MLFERTRPSATIYDRRLQLTISNPLMYRVIILIMKLLYKRVQISSNRYILQGTKQNRVCTHWSTRRNLSPSLCRHLPLLDNSFLEITIGCLTPLWNQVPSHFSGNVHSETNIANIHVNRRHLRKISYRGVSISGRNLRSKPRRRRTRYILFAERRRDNVIFSWK